MIQLTDSLYAIEVPKFSTDFETKNDGIPNQNYIDYWIGEKIGKEDLPQGEWQIIGIVTAKEIDFDCERYVKKQVVEVYYANYLKNKEDVFYFEMKKEDSFRSLIELKSGKTFSNPLGENFNESDYSCFDEIKDSAEVNVLKKVVILKQII